MKQLSQEDAERAIALALRAGSLLATVIMTLGLAAFVVRGTPAGVLGLRGIGLRRLFPGLARFDPAAIIELGIILLLITPVFRILVAALTFALERDGKYVLVSLGVLAVILISIAFTRG